MAAEQNTFAPDSDSARSVLEALALDRGTRLLSEQDYQEMRATILAELARGPHLRLSTLITFGVVALILFGLFVLGLALWVQTGPAEWLLTVSSGGCLLLCGEFLRRYIAGVRQQSRMSVQERIDELADLRRHALITQPEYEEIYAAILSCRIPA